MLARVRLRTFQLLTRLMVELRDGDLKKDVLTDHSYLVLRHNEPHLKLRLEMPEL